MPIQSQTPDRPIVIRDERGRQIATVRRDFVRPSVQVVRDNRGREVARMETRGNRVIITTRDPQTRRLLTVRR